MIDYEDGGKWITETNNQRQKEEWEKELNRRKSSENGNIGNNERSKQNPRKKDGPIGKYLSKPQEMNDGYRSISKIRNRAARKEFIIAEWTWKKAGTNLSNMKYVYVLEQLFS